MTNMLDSLLQYSDDLKQRLSLDGTNYPDANNNGAKLTRGDKYSLRPRSMRRDDTEICSKHPLPKSRHSKPKQKPAPLSKYRRKTANARERSRMREINAAFEALRQAVPHLQGMGATSDAANEKLTKITTLRLAMKYISALSAILKDAKPTASGTELADFLSDCSDLDYLLLESDGESLQLSDHSLLASPEFPDPALSPCAFDDHTLPTLLQSDFTDTALTSTEFSEFFLT